MDIAIVSSFALPLPAVKGGGVEWLVQSIIDENEKHHLFNFTVISTYDKQAEAAADKYKHTKFIFIQKNKLFYKYYGYLKKIFRKVDYFLPYINFLKKHFKKNKYDKIILENNINLIKAFNKTNAEIIFHLHNDTVNKKTVFPKEYTLIRQVFCVSNFIRSQVLSTGRFESERVKVLPNCNCMAEQKNAKDSDMLRSEMNISEDDVVFLYSGRIIREKGVYELVKAFSAVEQECKAKLIIVGGINYSNNSESEYLQQVREISSANVHFTGYVDYTSINSYYKISDVIVVPTLYFEDAAPLVVIEAMTEGIPIIAADSGGIWDYANEECGIKVIRDEDFIKTLSEKMIYLAKSKRTRDEMAKKAIASASKFTKEQYFLNFVDLIKQGKI